MYSYQIFVRASDYAIAGKIKRPDQLRELMRAPTTVGMTFEITDNDGIVIIRTSEVAGVSYVEEIEPPFAAKLGAKK